VFGIIEFELKIGLILRRRVFSESLAIEGRRLMGLYEDVMCLGLFGLWTKIIVENFQIRG
jgi:hypothetical protein